MTEGFAIHEIITDNTGTPIDYRFLDINPAFEHLTGLIRYSVLGKTVKEVIPEIEPHWIKIYGSVALSGEPAHFESYSAVLDKHYEVFAYCNASRQFAVIFRDVTERKKAEEALRESKEKYRIVADFTHDWEYWIDTDGSFNYLSPSVEAITGYTRQDFEEDPSLIIRIIHPEDRENVTKHFSQVATNRDNREVRFRIIRKDGEQRWIGHVCQPVFDSQEKLLGRRASNRDINATKEAEDALRESEQRLARSQEIAHLGSWELDLVKNELTWSDEVYRIFGLQPQEFDATYEAFLEAVHPDDRAAVDAAYSDSLREVRDGYEIDHRIIRKSDGDVRFVHEKCEHFRDSSGRIIRSIGMVHDITERKLTENLLIRSERRFELLSEIASNLMKSDNPLQLVNDLCRKVMTFLDCHVFFNYLVDNGKKRLHLNAYTGIPVKIAKEMESLDYNVAVSGSVARDGVRIVSENIPESDDSRTDLVRSFGIKAYACHPLLSKDRVIGTLSFGTRSRIRFTEDELELMKSVADQVAIAIERIRFLENLENQVQERTEELNKAYKIVKAERQQLYDVLDTLPAYVVLLTPDYHVPFANRFFEERFGKSNGQRCYEYLFNRTEPCEICETYTVIKTNAPHHWEWLGPDGRNYDIYDFPFKDTDGSNLVMEVGLDITEHKKAVDSLIKSERKYRELIEQAADGIAILDKHMNIVDVNPAACQMGGYSKEELIDLNVSQLIPEEDLINRPLTLDNVLAGGTVRTERRLKKKDGTVIDVDVSAKLLEDRTIQVIARDITERKEAAEQSLITSKLLELFVSEPTRKKYITSVVKEIAEWSKCCCVGIRIVDKNGYIPYEATTGFSEEFLRLENMLSLKKDMCACIRVITGEFEPQDASAMTPDGSFHINNSLKFLNGLTEQKKSRFRGNCIRNGFLSIAIIPIRYMGKPIGAIHLADEREGLVSLKLVKFIESIVAPLIGEAIQRFKVEEALRESEESLSKAQQIAHIGNWIWNVQADELIWSDEVYRIFGVTSELELNFKTFLNYIHPDDRKLAEKEVNEALYGRPYNIEHRIVLPDGTIRVVHEQGEVTFGESDEPVQMLVTVQDITDRKQAEIELMNSREQLRNLSEHLQSVREEERTHIAREIHDELGQALTALKMDISMISNKLYPNYKPLVEKTGSIMKRIDETIQAVKKICTELRPTVLDHFGLSAAIEWQAEDFQKTTGINCKVSFLPEDIVLDQDTSIVIFRIFQEALTNIMRHADATKVKASLKAKNSIITLEVIDNGKGITEEEITNSDSFGLLGIRERVNFLGGNVKISGIRNEGTTIKVNIPFIKKGEGHDENTHR
jgi:PAS domain S-box-containing protein